LPAWLREAAHPFQIDQASMADDRGRGCVKAKRFGDAGLIEHHKMGRTANLKATSPLVHGNGPARRDHLVERLDLLAEPSLQMRLGCHAATKASQR
jgi:hypothetical protein